MQNNEEKPDSPQLNKPESGVFNPIDRLPPGKYKESIEHQFEYISKYQSRKGSHAKKQLRLWCRQYAVFCLRIDVDPYERIAQNLDWRGTHVTDEARSRILVDLIKRLIPEFGMENKFLGLGQLWRAGLDNEQFRWLCGQNASEEEREKYDLAREMWAYEAAEALGLTDAKNADKNSLKCLFRDRKIEDFIPCWRETDEARRIWIPTVFVVGKTQRQIRDLRAAKIRIGELQWLGELNEEPLESTRSAKWSLFDDKLAYPRTAHPVTAQH